MYISRIGSYLFLLFFLRVTTAATSLGTLADDSYSVIQKRATYCPLNLELSQFCVLVPSVVDNGCDVTCNQLIVIEECSTSACVCSNSTFRIFASCLQCVVNKYKAYDYSIAQRTINYYGELCDEEGIRASIPTVTPRSKKLATGAIIGISVGVPVGVVLIISFIAFLLSFHVTSRRRKMLQGYYKSDKSSDTK